MGHLDARLHAVGDDQGKDKKHCGKSNNSIGLYEPLLDETGPDDLKM
jgi:hypothetical protein